MASSQTTCRAGPGVVYRPLNSPSLGDDSDFDNDRRKWKVTLSLTEIFRLVTAGLAFSDIIVWLVLSLISIRYSYIIVAFLELFFVVGWNLYLVIPPSRVARALPRVLCQIGNWTCALNRKDKDDRLPRKPLTKTQKQRKLVLKALVDVALGVSIIVIMAVFWPSVPIWYNYRSRRQCIFWINMVVGGLEIITAFLSLVDCFRSLVFEFGAVLRHIDDPDTRARVQLTPDMDYRRTAGGTVSIAA